MTALLALAVSLVLSRPALSHEDRDPKAGARAEVAKATLHYKLGRFEEALAAYTRAYELFDTPALLFNIAQCHKNLRNHERAIFFFQGYLREETDPKRRALAEDLLAKSRAELQRQRNEPPPAPPLPLPLPAAPVAEEPKAEPSKTLDLSVPRPVAAGPAPVMLARETEEEPPPILRRWWFWTAIGVGVLALAGGTIAYYASGETIAVPPTGTVGTLDRR